MKKEFLFLTLVAVALVGCKKDPTPVDPVTDLPEWYYTGGQLGTTKNILCLLERLNLLYCYYSLVNLQGMQFLRELGH